MLASYAGGDHRLKYGKQRRPDSGSLNFRQERRSRGVHDNIPLTHDGRSRMPAIAGRQNECHDVLS